MLRLSLEELILQILALDLGDPYTFLESAISPPENMSIRNALRFLDNLNAVVLEDDDEASSHSGKDGVKGVGGCSAAPYRLKSQITPLGFHLAALPINPRIGKLMLFGMLMGCVDPMLTIAATVSAKSPFLAPFDDRERADMAKLKFAEGDSDLLTMLNAYNAWKAISGPTSNSRGGSGGYQKRNPEEEKYCRDNYLSVNSLQLIDQMRGQFLDLIKDIGFLPPDCNINNVATRYENRNGTDRGMLGAVLCAGLAPNILQIPTAARPVVSGIMSKKIAEISLSSRGGPVFVHPSSTMSDRKSVDSYYMVYLEALKTSKVYARDVTSVTPMALALFGGRLKIYERHGVVTIEDWLAFKVSGELSKLLVTVR
jgi:HrpA-like RNA helicase